MEQEYPELNTRIQSTFIDGILILVLMFAAGWALDKAGIGEEENSGIIKAIIFVSIWGFQAIVRLVFKFSLGWLSFLTIHFDDQRRAIHHMAAGSVMLEK